MGTLEMVLGWSIPVGTLTVAAVGVFELARQRRRKRTRPLLAATYVNELGAMFDGTKRMQLDHRDSTSVMREDDAQGAPPGRGVDLDRGVVVLRPDDSGSGLAAR